MAVHDDKRLNADVEVMVFGYGVKHFSLPLGKEEGGLGQIRQTKMTNDKMSNGASPLKFNQGKMLVTKKLK